jgi:hypothetical protein
MDRHSHRTAWSRATSRLSLWARSALLLRNGALLLRRRRAARLLVLLLLLLLRWWQPLSALLRWSTLLLGLRSALLLRGRLAHRRRGRHGGIIERYTSASESSNTIARVSSRTDMSV